MDNRIEKLLDIFMSKNRPIFKSYKEEKVFLLELGFTENEIQNPDKDISWAFVYCEFVFCPKIDSELIEYISKSVYDFERILEDSHERSENYLPNRMIIKKLESDLEELNTKLSEFDSIFQFDLDLANQDIGTKKHIMQTIHFFPYDIRKQYYDFSMSTKKSLKNSNPDVEKISDLIECLGFARSWKNCINEYNDRCSELYGQKETKQQKEKVKTPKPKPNQLQTNLTDPQRGKLFDLLVSNEFIPDNDKDGFIWAFGGENKKCLHYSTEWLKTLNLSVYLIDRICKNYEKTWVIGERIFSNVKGMRQMKDHYQDNTNGNKNKENTKDGKPKGYKLIDTIISEAQK